LGSAAQQALRVRRRTITCISEDGDLILARFSLDRVPSLAKILNFVGGTERICPERAPE
jgi:hypothetical protein